MFSLTESIMWHSCTTSPFVDSFGWLLGPAFVEFLFRPVRPESRLPVLSVNDPVPPFCDLVFVVDPPVFGGICPVRNF